VAGADSTGRPNPCKGYEGRTTSLEGIAFKGDRVKKNSEESGLVPQTCHSKARRSEAVRTLEPVAARVWSMRRFGDDR
jgi:hypothetical protein